MTTAMFLIAATIEPQGIEATHKRAAIRSHFPRAFGFMTFMLAFRQVTCSMFTVKLRSKHRFFALCSNEFFVPKKTSLRLFQLSRDPHQYHRTDESDDDRAAESARVESQQPKHKAANNCAKNSKDNINHHAISAALHHLSGEPAGDQPNYDPVNEFPHDCPLLFLPAPKVRPNFTSLLERALPNVNCAAYTD
jgi:hypothetical protein